MVAVIKSKYHLKISVVQEMKVALFNLIPATKVVRTEISTV